MYILILRGNDIPRTPLQANKLKLLVSKKKKTSMNVEVSGTLQLLFVQGLLVDKYNIVMFGTCMDEVVGHQQKTIAYNRFTS